ncbi:hypothetical protein D3C75_666200 [compost metagenome]
MHSGELAHFAGADNQRILVLQPVQNPLAQLHRRVADGNGILPDGGFCVGAFSEGHCLFKKSIKERSRRRLTLGQEESVLNLAENLRFADNHGIQPGGNPEQMLHGQIVFIHIQIRLKLAARNLEPLLHKAPEEKPRFIFAVYCRVYFSTVAGAHNDTFQHAFGTFKNLKRVGQPVGRKGEFLPDFNRSRSMIKSHRHNVHMYTRLLLVMGLG